jgi:acetyl-CoA C-acetyltransferase
MEEVFIVSTARTPIGRFGGSLANFSAIDLGAHAIQGALNKAGIGPERIQEVFLGNVIPANLGQAPARQTALKAGIGYNIPCTLINKVCASGMKSIMIGAQSIMLGTNDLVVAGGMESMSNIPYYIPKARFGYKYGNAELIDGLQKDGLWEAYHQFAMGNCADHTASDMKISREEQDEFAIESYKRAIKATENGFLKDEIVPIEIPQRKGDPLIMDEDEEIKSVNFDKIPNLRPVFSKEGTVTAANASTINDGASAVVLASKKAIEEYNLSPLAKILGFADAAQEPIWFTTTPSIAIPKALQNAGISQDKVDFYEINEAFAVVVLANNKLLDLDPDKVNVHGGAVSIGHPIGCSGARITGTLANTLKATNRNIGVAGICNGGGGASAIVLENC